MIHRVYSSDPAFKPLEFRPGFNVLIADKAPKATDLQSRNGAGKSSLIRLIHFLMGGSCKKGECVFLDPLLAPHTFGMEFDLGAGRVAVERSASKPSRIYFRNGNFTNWPVRPQVRRGDSRPTLSNEDWKAVLGSTVFGLRLETDEERAEKFVPTFRTLLPYFARLHEDGAFLEPYKIHAEQQLWSQQVAIAFLLGLDWRIPQGMQLVRSRQRTIRQLREVLEESGEPMDLLPRSDELQAKLTLAIDRAARVKKSLSEFRINPQYHDLEGEVDTVTRDITRTLDEDSWDRELSSGLEQALSGEAPPDPDDLQRLYREAGVELPETSLRRFDDVRKFHESVIRNRQSYLQGELNAARARLADRDARRRDLDSRRAQLMILLSSTGALEHFTELQSELGRLEGAAEALRRQTAAARQMEDTQLQLGIETAELELRLGRNHEEQRDRIEDAQLLFAELSGQLYETPGTLTVSRKLTGPPVRAFIHGQESVGITKMQIFCFDLTLARLVLKQGIGPRFLLHDSHLFDGVDPRQARHALALCIRETEAHGYQYLVTLNSDKVASIKDAGLDVRDFALPVRLTDQETGGLFGKRFG